MNYKHNSQIERYQIHSLMKARHNLMQIARLLGRDKFPISPCCDAMPGVEAIKLRKPVNLPANALSRAATPTRLRPRIDEALGSMGYFAPHFASWEPGSNENFNGLLRQYVPQ